MPNNKPLYELLGETDIYLLDQIMKGRYEFKQTILDAGCGNGRNLHWFLQNDFTVYGIDSDVERIKGLISRNPGLPAGSFFSTTLESTPFPDNHFDHIICSAVLHFAKNVEHFNLMFTELLRVLKPGGSLFIRMASDIGIEDNIQPVSEAVYHIPDGSTRFLLTRSFLKTCMQQKNLSFIEPLKTVNVNDIRCMSTLVLQNDKTPNS